ncbi:sugar transporter family protein [Mollisia scopiformis]|uniref:Sugar transporter family protein n=1 Tax=Mollisia scopiformis TaxID=149040 RepID=A0A194X963_MOLSC|nr:sugar transporter family protein [Mollisia scopiformis]KUJ16322.1 sugar transporter family protein [Mollisia scopiformis]
MDSTHQNGSAPTHGMVKQFLTARLQSLKPTNEGASPFALLAKLSTRQWQYLFVSFLAWTWDAFDFYSISTVIPQLTTYGRKWPFVINCLLLSILELCLAFCKTYTPFIVCRALFGLAMGGYDCPEPARGLVAGCYQAGYPMGFLFATALWRAFDQQQEGDWKHLFYFAACPPLLLIAFRIYLPETNFFEHRIRPRNNGGNIFGFMVAVNEAIKRHWKRIIYLIAFMFGCTFLSHGSEDVFPLMLTSQYGYSANEVTATQSVAYIGAVIGSLVVGFGSQIIGRRFSIIVACIAGAMLIYPYCFVSGPGLYPVVFLVQFIIQGIFGIVSMHLIELSPPAFRTFVVGTSYNLGVLLASWVPVVETFVGEKRKDTNESATRGYQYSTVMAALLSCAFLYTIIVTFLGPENRDAEDDEDSGRDGVSIHFMVEEAS